MYTAMYRVVNLKSSKLLVPAVVSKLLRVHVKKNAMCLSGLSFFSVTVPQYKLFVHGFSCVRESQGSFFAVIAVRDFSYVVQFDVFLS